MAPRQLRALPLLLRRELFGGLLFSPEEAVHIELDRDAFDFLSDHYLKGRRARTDEERALLHQVRREVGHGRRRDVRAVHNPPLSLAQPFTVLSAPTLADFQITERCNLRCPHCYASSTATGGEASLEEIDSVLGKLSAAGVAQIALGGGEPLLHPDILEVLARCHHHGLLPNLTTNGLLLDRQTTRALRRYCGAVGLSLEGVGDAFARRRGISFELFQQRLQQLIDGRVATVLQVTLSQENLDALEEIVAFCLGVKKLYGVLFLAYKEVGRGASYHHALAQVDGAQVHEQLRGAFSTLSRQTRVGYDCCLTPGLTGIESDLSFEQGDQLEGCSALRGSLGILPSLDVVPCTFTPESSVGSLRQSSLAAIWDSDAAHAFRDEMARHLDKQRWCDACESRSACLGGCPVFDLVRCARTP